MSTLLEQALEKVASLPADEQEAIASRILESLADEAAWKTRFSEKRDVIRRMAREALDEHAKGETMPFKDVSLKGEPCSRYIQLRVLAAPVARPVRSRRLNRFESETG